ncbi:AAA family ATPase [Oceanirhabdus sp. W0125-5]|uniref:AAA family ATPase n=1 Tax=Oceanirhabdus sp. W0125-5 TaxID=2999116 RepID=UPI0022F2FD6C|nr:AAA family ATPase [Oceanirhabdus sp. W0125-5]WBW97731.1 hypothetical protein OW730_02830 [Oceanirhabdus sp. W0125-5]
MKVYIVGSVASGKTTFAKKLSDKLGIECTHLDGIVHIKDKTNKEWGNIRRTDDEIDRLFIELINKQQWIIEDAGRKCFSEGMEKADIIIYLKPSKFIRKKRIITRYIKQKIGLEDCLYTPNLRMLKFMFRAIKNYEIGKDDLESRLSPYNNKTVTLKNNKEIKQFMFNLRNKAIGTIN